MKVLVHRVSSPRHGRQIAGSCAPRAQPPIVRRLPLILRLSRNGPASSASASHMGRSRTAWSLTILQVNSVVVTEHRKQFPTGERGRVRAPLNLTLMRVPEVRRRVALAPPARNDAGCETVV